MLLRLADAEVDHKPVRTHVRSFTSRIGVPAADRGTTATLAARLTVVLRRRVWLCSEGRTALRNDTMRVQAIVLSKARGRSWKQCEAMWKPGKSPDDKKRSDQWRRPPAAFGKCQTNCYKVAQRAASPLTDAGGAASRSRLRRLSRQAQRHRQPQLCPCQQQYVPGHLPHTRLLAHDQTAQHTVQQQQVAALPAAGMDLWARAQVGHHLHSTTANTGPP